MADCEICETPMRADTAYVCSVCAGRLTKDLTRAVDLLGELELTITRQAVTGQGSARAGSEQRLPFDAAAALVAQTVANTVLTWVRLVCEERGETVPERSGRHSRTTIGPRCRPVGTCPHEVCADARAYELAHIEEHPLASAVRFLASRVEWLRHQRFAGEAVADLSSAASILRRAVDRYGDRSYLGPCGYDDGTGECGSDLYVRTGAAYATCRDCGSQWDVAALRRWLLAAVEDALAPAHVIARGLSALGEDVKYGSLTGWASKGQLLAHPPLPGTRAPLYRVGDVLDLVARTVRRKNTTELVRALLTKVHACCSIRMREGPVCPTPRTPAPRTHRYGALLRARGDEMPRRALRTCTVPGCPVLVPSGRCDAHERAAAQRRGSAASRGYGHRHRVRFREAVLARDPVCTCTDPHRWHGVGGCAAFATVADHHPLDRAELVRRRLDPDHPRYGRGLCTRCHNAATARNQSAGWHAAEAGDHLEDR